MENKTVNKIYLDVPYHEKDDAKKHGAKWDPRRKQWWIPADKKTPELMFRWGSPQRTKPVIEASTTSHNTTGIQNIRDVDDVSIDGDDDMDMDIPLIDTDIGTDTDNMIVRAKSDNTIRGWFDGGSRGNPGRCGYGCILRNGDDSVIGIRMGGWNKGTNNEAEYNGCIELLQMIITHIEKRNKEPSTFTKDINVEVYGDSKLVIKQLKEEWGCKTDTLEPYVEKGIRLIKIIKDSIGVGKLTLGHVFRENNKSADALANLVMDQISK